MFTISSSQHQLQLLFFYFFFQLIQIFKIFKFILKSPDKRYLVDWSERRKEGF